VTQIICECKRLVEVVDRTVSLHYSKGDGIVCPKSGTRYVPQRKVCQYDPAGPEIQVLHSGKIGHGGHEDHVVLLAAGPNSTPDEVAAAAVSAIGGGATPTKAETIN